MNCIDCGQPITGATCEHVLCPGTAQARWDAALEAERQMIADLNADDGTGQLTQRWHTVHDSFRDAWNAAASRAWIRAGFTRNGDAFWAAVKAWNDRAAMAARRQRDAQEATDRARIAEIRVRYQSDPRLTLEEFKLLLIYAYEEYDMDTIQLGASVEKLLTVGSNE